ncbi:putative muramidase [Xylaria digitata]|nr:putative muramidase [Xylaria digitata]
MVRSTPPIPAQHLSESERIKVQMTSPELRDSVWGFVVYRCTGRNETAWQRMIAHINDTGGRISIIRGRKHGRASSENLRTNRIYDCSGATHHDVRDYFLQWVPKDLQSRLSKNSKAGVKDLEMLGVADCPRYECCILIDDLCMESLDYPRFNSPVFKLVWRKWGPATQDERQAPIHPDFHDGQTEYLEEDVGWMYMPVRYYIDIYDRLGHMDWEDVYVRPPYILGNETEDSFPGHWRRNIKR